MKIKIATFKGIVPIADPRLLAPEIATSANNCRFERGNLEPYNELSPVAATITANTKSLFYYHDASDHWFSWATDVDVILSPTIGDDRNTIIWTGDVNGARIGYNNNVTGNATPPNVSYKLGVPAPASKLQLAIANNDQDEEGTDNDETRYYVYTYVTENGEEGAPSPVSDKAVILNTNASVTVTIPSLITNNHNIQQMRIYRSGTTLDSANFYWVATLALSANEYTDNATELTGVTLDTVDFDLPPTNLQGLTVMPNGIAVGFFDKTICFSEAYLPYAWPVGYQQTTDHNIIGLAVMGNSVVVTTEGNPHIFTGVTPDSMSGLKLEQKQSCVSKRSIVDMGDYVLYASPDGLVAVGSSSTNVITAPVIRRDQWQEKYNPTTIHACYFEGKYIAFYGGVSGFIYDPQTETLVDLDFYADATYNDLKQDTLYLNVGDTLQAWDGGAEKRVASWKKRFELNGTTIPACIRIEADNIALVTFKLWVDGTLQETINPSAETFWLPPLRGEYFEIEVSGKASIQGIIMAENMRDLHHG